MPDRRRPAAGNHPEQRPEASLRRPLAALRSASENYRVQPTVQIDQTAMAGDGSSVRELAQIRKNARPGESRLV